MIPIESELVAYSLHRKKKYEKVIKISASGWVTTDSGTLADYGKRKDCIIEWKQQGEYLKQLRKKYRLSQFDMSLILDVSRPTYNTMENYSERRELTHKEFLILQLLDPFN